MDLIGLLRILFWRWMIVVPILLLTGAAAVTLWLRVGPSFEASGSVIILGPSTSPDPDVVDGRNPYLDLGNLAVPANVLTEIALGDDVRRGVVSAGGQGQYDIVLDGARGPILVVKAEGPSAAIVETTVQLVMEELDSKFEDLQSEAGAPRESFLTLTPVSAPADAQVLYASRLRAVFGVVVAGGALAVGLALATEALLRSRRRSEHSASIAEIATASAVDKESPTETPNANEA